MGGKEAARGTEVPPSRKKRLTSTFQLCSTLPCFILFLSADSLPFSPHDSIFLLSVSTASLSSSSPQFLPCARLLPLSENKIKKQSPHFPELGVSSVLPLKSGGRLICASFPRTLTRFHSHHTKASPSFSPPPPPLSSFTLTLSLLPPRKSSSRVKGSLSLFLCLSLSPLNMVNLV